MRKNLLTTIGAGFLTGSFLVMAAGTAQAADQYPQGSGSQYQQDKGQSSQDAGQNQPRYDQQYRNSGDRDMYDSRDPTAAGAQGPMRNDMDRNMDRNTYGAPSSYDSSSSYNASMYGSSSSMWDDLRKRLGPIGGEGTN